MSQQQSQKQGYAGANFVLLVRGRCGWNQVSTHCRRNEARKRASTYEGETAIAKIKRGKLLRLEPTSSA
jgi:hypothetical protein